jgi:ABC-type sugar transport system permease subunit
MVGKPRRKRRDWGTVGFVATLLAPGLLPYGLLVLWPMAQSFYVAVHRWRGVSGNMVFVGLENFGQLAQDEKFRQALTHNLLFFVMIAVSTLTLALFFANALAQRMRGVELFRALFLFPNVVSVVAVSTLWMFIYNANWGLLNGVLRLVTGPRGVLLLGLTITIGVVVIAAVGTLAELQDDTRPRSRRAGSAAAAMLRVPNLIAVWFLVLLWIGLYVKGEWVAARLTEASAITWLANPKTVLPSVAATYVWYVLGFYILLFRAGIQNISGDVNEAAEIDGATNTQRFWFVTLPLLNDIMRLSVIYLIINAMNIFALVWVMAPPSGTAGATEMSLTYLYQKGFVEQQFGYSTAIGAVNFLIVMGITLVLQRVWRTSDA